MELVSVTIENFRRFAGKHKLVLDGKVVAIIGPNEAGKTSILRALEHFNHSRAFKTTGGQQETTRGVNIRDEAPVIEATYWVNGDDRAALSQIPEACDVRWVKISKRAEGNTFYVTQKPRPKRDLSQRRAAAGLLKNLQKVPDSWNAVNEDSTDAATPIDHLRSVLISDEEDLTADQIEWIRSFARIEDDHILTDADRESLTKLADYESLENPEARSRKLLYSREPTFLLFDNESRTLQSQYDLDDFFRSEPRADPIPSALENLCAAAQLNLSDLHNAADIQDHGEVDSIVDAANANLEQLLRANWSQSEVSARLRLDGKTLHVLAGARGNKFVRISERSDGLRQYVALLAFLSRHRSGDALPVLLIDEAETHLHYDAQADLIQMLTKQSVAAKVVYTTHSIGCLPEDLGMGLRMVEAKGEHSRINNWFWQSNTPGFSPILFGIGATTLAFVPIRNALLTEGATDILLLPALLREALSRDHLGFQVAPGLSKANKSQVAIVDAESPRTAYLTDSDEGGDDLRSQIIAAGVPEHRIFALPKIDGVATTIEDFLRAESLIHAINVELSRSHGIKHQMSLGDLRQPGATESVEKWCEMQSIPPPKKRAVAYHLLEHRHRYPLVSENTRQQVVNLFNIISAVFDDS